MGLSIKLLTGEGHLPIHRQLVNGIRHAISSGRVLPNERLPSVRSLAASLRIAPNTVAHAYRELEREGLTENIAGSGTFVRDLMPEQDVRNSLETASVILRPALLSLSAIGMSRAEILDCVQKLLTDGPIVLGVVGPTRRTARKWSNILHAELNEFWIETVPITSADFARPEEVLKKLANATYVFTLLVTYSVTRSSLAESGKQVLPLITELSISTHQALSQLPQDRRIGLVCEEIYANNVLEVLSNYCDISRIHHINGDDPDEIGRLLNEVEVTIHSFVTGEAVAAANHAGRKVIPLEYYISKDNISKIKEILSIHGYSAAQRAA